MALALHLIVIAKENQQRGVREEHSTANAHEKQEEE